MQLTRTADQITASNLGFELTDAEVATLGAGKRPPVVLAVNGRSVRVRVAPMGGCNLIGITKANRALLGLEPGVEYAIEVTLDDAERTVEVPTELAAAFDGDPALGTAWDGLSFTRRRELAEGITGAKRPETRARRVATALDTLRG
ncbi:YdeI/OmpD-associated family protein [Propioniciclava sp. MC1683]|uniref:YdeI/OmpD-associated family protein n=1 Tax=Propioniciclava sp. MC1683 TaxID=2760309 RepID=UPI0016001E27|nr:YdeI/OmpD-associated family protein [Propioniciclava sp. MC1683]MBB1500332.1 YdeI/OmpD-associated family protein [Propioniciclava sp. MC1683]